ncbi:TRAP transporter large permease subunit (plasmid) [Azospirillum brasilense]|uniref:TRAP transporter large permease protein n=1 Tax=Azospirillum brasilense TaxID=192 RepID=A0A4D8QPW4_AZOBR|nr:MULTISPECIES: TRAP transporter large permease subunit [Azospirillum]MDW7554607.1 TRAP transporter large permease subunit [Azospirillum brasilense]MDW7593875.1 TRAP transporter large permease subunit [Azospirillum brasilense]MDW7632561.1 TRAP transporter large permease subunit [Azospirillum brasilense]MDX5950155.1 TRAP transporter large permease subunit [Azospirillum brasilense]OPH11836.1 C4-dicarboxylate ABC transporter permease [Azospirillum brasilense]
MEQLGSAGGVALFMLLILGGGVWLFPAFLLVGVVGLFLFNGMDLTRIGPILSQVLWRSAASFELSAIPLFIFMGEIIFNTNIAQKMFRGISPYVDRVPGRLLHSNVGGCTIFAALCGSSVATTATIGRITINELSSRGYDRSMMLGSLAGAGSFGLMIPPSINLIIYGVLAEQPIAQLFAAGVLPGLLLASLYSAYIAIRCWMDPSMAPKGATTFTWWDRLRGIWDLGPVALLIGSVAGSIYSGIATPSESAVIGLLATVILAGVTGQLSIKMLKRALLATVKTSCMILTLMAGAGFLAVAMGYLHVPQEVAAGIGSLNLSPMWLLVLLTLFYIVLGCFLDGISLMVTTLAIVLPLVVNAGFDPIWFGIYLIIVTELALITPPVGLNLFVLQGLTKLDIRVLAVAAMPFFFLILLAGVILTVFPQIALWLPDVLFDK